MSKNIVFMVNISDPSRPERSKPYHLSIKSWKHWADKNNADLFILTERVFPEEYMNANWHKALALKLLRENNIDYDQVLVVDADTIVHPDCPDFFQETDYKLSAVNNEGCYEWVNRSIQNYGDFIFPTLPKVKTWEYFNTGFVIMNDNHYDFFEKVIQFYHDNVEKFIEARNFYVGNDQTPLNYFVKLYNVDVKLLPLCYNLQDMARKNLITTGYQNWSPEPLYLRSGWVYHFNSIPEQFGDSAQWIEYTYKLLYT